MSNASADFYGTLPANSDLSASQYCAIYLNSSGKAILPSANGPILGVMTNDPAAADRPATYQRIGAAKMKLGGTVAKADPVKVDSSGRAVTASADDIAAGYAIGVCVDGGAVNNIGTVELTALGVGSNYISGSETLTTGGAASLLTVNTYLEVTGTDAISLADGLYVGQRKWFECTVAASTPVGTLTPATVFGTEPATWVFKAVGQGVGLEWTATGWKAYRVQAAGQDTPAAASTINQLFMTHAIAITGTQDWVLGSGTVPGQIQNFKVLSAASTPVGTISGLFYDEDSSADGVDIQLDAAADMASVVWDGARWDPIQLIACAIA